MQSLCKKVKISVLLPFYNARKTLRRALESLSRQSIQNFEIIAVDDGSSDKSSDLLSDLKIKNLHLIRLPQNRGLPAALNIAIENSRGLFLARMDADDECHPDRLKQQLLFLENNPTIGICGCQVLLKSPKGHGRWSYPKDPARSRALLFLGCPVAHPAVMMRKDIFQKGTRYDETYQGGGEDWDLWDRIGDQWAMVNLPKTLLVYHLTAEGMSRSGRQRQMLDRARVAERILRRLGIPSHQTMVDLHLEITQPPDTISETRLIEHLSHLENLSEKIVFEYPKIKKAWQFESFNRWFQLCRRSGPKSYLTFLRWFNSAAHS